MSKPKLSDYIRPHDQPMVSLTTRIAELTMVCSQGRTHEVSECGGAVHQAIADIITHVLAEREGAALRELRDRLQERRQRPVPAPPPTAGVTEAAIEAWPDTLAGRSLHPQVIVDSALAIMRTLLSERDAARAQFVAKCRDHSETFAVCEMTRAERDALKAECNTHRKNIDEAAAEAECAPHDVAGAVRRLKAEVERLRAEQQRFRAIEAAARALFNAARMDWASGGDIKRDHKMISNVQFDALLHARKVMAAALQPAPAAPAVETPRKRDLCNVRMKLSRDEVAYCENPKPCALHDAAPTGWVTPNGTPIDTVDAEERLRKAQTPAKTFAEAQARLAAGEGSVTLDPSCDEPDDLEAAIANLRRRVEALERERKGGSK